MITNSSQSQVLRKCPQCSSANVTRSQRIDLFDRVFSIANIYPYRCKQHTCNHRFTSFGRD